MKPTALALLLLASVAASSCATHDEATSVSLSPVSAATGKVAMSELPSTFEAGGTVRARVTAQIASRIMAPVTDVRVRAGDRVTRGTPLVTLDQREMVAHRDRAVASVAAAEQSAAAAEADVAAAEAQMRLARATHQRIADLAAKRSATPQELDQAVSSMSAAEAQVRAAQARRSAARASSDAAQAATSAADAGVDYTVLSAPFDGVVTERAIDPGAMATPGAPLLTLEDPASFRLEVRLDEARAAHVAPGQQVEVSLGDGAPARAWVTATVAEIARLDPASHAFVVKLDLPASEGLRSGVFGRARFTTETRTAITVPASAIVRRGQLAFVFAVDGENRARLRAVSTGAVAGDRVEALAGVKDGDVVVLNPPPDIVDGSPVQATATVARGEGR